MNMRSIIIALWIITAPMIQETKAQRPLRSGFWLENGVGTGTARITCTTCDEAVKAYGESSYLRGGGQLSDRVFWGIEVFVLLDKTFGLAEGDSSLTITNGYFGPVVLWYPWRSEVFVKGGLGLSRGEVSVPNGDGDLDILAQGIGSGLTFGVGFDIAIFKWLAWTVNFGMYFTAIGDVIVQDTYVDDIIVTMYNANFAITIR